MLEDKDIKIPMSSDDLLEVSCIPHRVYVPAISIMQLFNSHSVLPYNTTLTVATSPRSSSDVRVIANEAHGGRRHRNSSGYSTVKASKVINTSIIWSSNKTTEWRHVFAINTEVISRDRHQRYTLKFQDSFRFIILCRYAKTVDCSKIKFIRRSEESFFTVCGI